MTLAAATAGALTAANSILELDAESDGSSFTTATAAFCRTRSEQQSEQESEQVLKR